jgi:tetratricopeptide (TPR) repeat protein
LFVGLAYLLYRAVTAPTIEIFPIVVPKNLAEQGYTSEAVSLQLREALRDLIKDAKTTKTTANVVRQGDDAAIELPQTGMSLDTIASQLRVRLGIGNSWKASGNIESDDDQLTLNVSLDGQKEYRKLIIKGNKHSVDDLFSRAAREMFDVIDPYVVASSLSDKDPAKSIALARKIIATHPTSDPDVAWAHILISYVLEDNPAESEKEAKAAIDLDPSLEAAHYNLGLSLLDQGKLDLAIDELQKAIKINPRDADVFDLFGEALQKKNELTKAIEVFKESLEIDPSNADAYVDLGSALQKQGEPNDAIHAFQKAIGADPRSADGYVSLGGALEQQGEFRAAIDALDRAVEIEPKNAEACFKLGVALEAQGRLDPSIDAFNKDVNFAAATEEFRKAVGIDRKVTEYQAALNSALWNDRDSLPGNGDAGPPHPASQQQDARALKPSRSP